MAGRCITVLEQSDRLGGSLDGAGSPETGYVIRGGRMLEAQYVCTYDLFSTIPTMDGSRTVTEEIFDWNKVLKTSSRGRLVQDCRALNKPGYGLTRKHILALETLMIEPEALLGRTSIEGHFDSDFFDTNFWLMWSSTFAFQSWHSAIEFKRYLTRFVHMVPGFNQLHGIMRTVYNQYDSMIRPLQKWLLERGVHFEFDITVTDLGLRKGAIESRVEKIFYTRERDVGEIVLGQRDLVILTLGSMTESSTLGDNQHPAPLRDGSEEGCWALWKKIALGHREFGHPETFSDHIDQSKWISTTTTLRSHLFLNFMRDFTGNVPGEGGLVTLIGSNWLLSMVLPHQPHFIGQPHSVDVFWAYGLRVEAKGNFVKKPMQQCSGREILTELLCHLGMHAPERYRILADAITIPCMMPFITSQFLPRSVGDRPQVRPAGWKNLALIGQFCEQPHDVVFTVEYSVRSAATAVYSLLGLALHPPPVYDGQYHPVVVRNALKELHEGMREPRREVAPLAAVLPDGENRGI